MHFVELIVIDVGSLDNLDLSDLDVLDGVDGGDILGDLLLNDLAGEHIQDLGDVGFGDLLGDDVVDLLPDDFLLGGKGVVSFSLLVGGLFGEADHKDTDDVSIAGLDVGDSFDEGFSLFDQGADLVLGGVNTVETGDGLPSFGLINNELNFSPVETILVGGKIGLHLGDNSSSHSIFDLF